MSDMKPLRKVNNLLYAAGPELVNTIRMELEMTEPVDPQALSGALACAAARFPYFAVTPVRRGSEYLLAPNARPFVVSPRGGTVTLGAPESNGHLFAFAYDGCRLYMDTTHFLTDGNGLFPFLKSILYYYLRALHPDTAFDTAGIALAGSAVPEDEADDDPYPAAPLPTAPLGDPFERPAALFRLPDQPEGYENACGWTSFRFRVRQKDMMAYVSGVDGSPASFVAALLYLAVSDCHPENHLPLVCGMQHQFRQALGRPRSHMCHVNVIPMVYPDTLRGRDIERLNTISRGALILRADPANDVLTVNAHVRNEALIRGMPLPEKRAFMRRALLDGIGENTYEVSYTGRVAWCGLDRYVRSVVPYFDLTLSGGLSAEIFSVNDVFCVNLMQRSRDPRYAARFAARLRASGIDCEADAPEHFSLCGFCLPD